MFCTRPDSPLFTGYRVKRRGRGLNHLSLSSAEVKDRVELYLYSSSVSSWQVIRWTLPSFEVLSTHVTWQNKVQCACVPPSSSRNVKQSKEFLNVTVTFYMTFTFSCTRWFKYDRDYLYVNKSQFVPVIFEPTCIKVLTLKFVEEALQGTISFKANLIGLCKKDVCFIVLCPFVVSIFVLSCRGSPCYWLNRVVTT
jgi:hypothetical protein